ncbi:MAG: rRNA adenine N-6-methyltransferase family protein [Erysipelotrichaceae bacterium]
MLHHQELRKFWIGTHFELKRTSVLIEPGIVEKIAQNAIIEHPCVVMEIGPGIGALTQALATYADKVVSFEIDSRLIDVLNTELSE